MQKDIIQGIRTAWEKLPQQEGIGQGERVLADIIECLTEGEQMSLTTDFGRLSYFIQKHQLPTRAKHGLFRLRSTLKKWSQKQSPEVQPSLLWQHLGEVLIWFEKVADPSVDTLPFFPSSDAYTDNRNAGDQRNRIADLRLLVLGRTEDQKAFLVVDENNPQMEMRLDLPEQAGPFDKSIESYFGHVLEFPLYIHAFDVSRYDDYWICGHYVLHPDYLVDVTAIASGYSSSDFSIRQPFLHRVLPRVTSYHMLLGNIVNHLLDRLIIEKDYDLNKLYRDIFNLFPIDLARMDDDEVRKLLSALQQHFSNLKQAVEEDFGKLEIDASKCDLEPTFLSSKYGLQGRLDVLMRGAPTTIIELKSGKPYRPNSYGIKSDHFVQTLLYDLLIRSSKISQSPRNFILYSSQSEQKLRYAPPVKAIQVDALRARNQLIITDALLKSSSPEVIAELFRQILSDIPSDISSFTRRDLELVNRIIGSSTELERSYYFHFFSFVMRELSISKTGLSGRDGPRGLASIWLDEEVRKQEEFNILSGLVLDEVIYHGGDVFLELNFGQDTDPLANFRNGDVVVLYPARVPGMKILEHQMYKCSLVERHNDRVRVRLRSKQLDEDRFQIIAKWNLERDVLDSSFNSLFDSLFLFLGAPDVKKRLLLGLEFPTGGDVKSFDGFVFSEQLMPEQLETVKRIVNAKDYFLLWGPPGTGKTSVMIRELVRLYFDTTDKDIYLLAYTNRAVDEMCSVIKDLGGEIETKAVRLGSRYSTESTFHSLLFDQQIEQLDNRNEIRKFIHKKRIFLSTVASFWGRRELIKKPGKGLLIVDEASQILEPTIIGLLSYFEKFIMVGDHLQLPAVSSQSDEMAIVSDSRLEECGISNMKTSFFERLYTSLVGQEVADNFAVLEHQGRMHQDIMSFVNQQFYENALKLVPGYDRIIRPGPGTPNWPAMSRLVYIESMAAPAGPMIKNNEDEAIKTVEFIRLWLNSTGKNMESLKPTECGVITPFRAQIALIKHKLFEAFGPASEIITVDTVERYQGGARDLVILSLCLNRKTQLKSVVSLSDQGVDRKFNVALTRARERVVVIGEKEILEGVVAYQAFIRKAQLLKV